MALSVDDILKTFHAGEHDRLVGQFESEFLECKGEPYGLDRDERKLELAKDISGLANASAGLLLIGFATRTSTTHGEDEIHSVRPFPLTLFNPDQYRQIIASWLWPPVEKIDVRIFPLAADPERAVAAIVVPVAEDADKPILISKSLLDGPRRIELLFGYCERKQAQVSHHSIARLHELLRDGRRVDDEIRSGFATVMSAVSALQSPEVAPTPPPDVPGRIAASLRTAERENHPNFILAAVPPRSLDLRGLFESRRNRMVQLLEDPPAIRDGGFGLYLGGNSKRAGNLRRVTAEGRGLLEAYRDGVVVFVREGDSGRLCWGRRGRQGDIYLVNQLALIEMVYLFCLFVREIFSGKLESKEVVELRLEVRNLSAKNGTKFFVEPGPIDTFGGPDVAEAPSDSISASSNVVYEIDTPERWAVELLGEFYALFGYERDRIPYTAESEGGRVVDPEQIIAAGR